MARVSKKATQESDEADWDYARAVRGGPAKNPRAVVSVSMKTAEFRLIAQAAQAARMKTSEFIRAAALQAASPQRHEPTVWPLQSTGFTLNFQINADALIGARSIAESPTLAPIFPNLRPAA